MKFKNIFEISVKCPICGQFQTLYVEKDDYLTWMSKNTHVQDTFSYLTPSQREILISGTCPKCWDNLFKNVG